MLKHLLRQRLIKHSEIHGINVYQIYGSRKENCPYDVSVMMKDIYNMERYQHDYLIYIFSDLKGNYDRVCPALNTITPRRMGLPEKVVMCHAAALQK